MRARGAAMLMAGAAAVVSSTAAALTIWLILTRPLDVAETTGAGGVMGLVKLMATALSDILDLR